MSMIDLTNLISGTVDKVKIDEEYDLNGFKTKDILEVSKIKVKGYIGRESDNECYTNLLCNGKMLILDSISLEEVWYPFSFNIDEPLEELLENNEKNLDIINILWQNIVLEVPLRFSKVEDYKDYHGDGWKLVSEEELSLKNNPFAALQNNMDGSD